MTAPPGFVELRKARSVAWLRADLQATDVAAWWADPEPLPGAKGRGGVGTLQLGGVTAVVRTLRRGGAFAKLLGDRYPGPSRVRKELEVTCRLREEGVPVVVPLAALARRPGTFWRLRFATQLEAGAVPLPRFCADEPARRRWAVEAAAVTVRLAFAAGLRHPDLHPDNLLCGSHGDKVRAVLVDLDRATIAAPPGEAQRDAMLVRMARYVHKHQRSLPTRFSTADHLRFLRGLGLDRDGRHAAFVRLRRALERALRRRLAR